MSKMKEYDKSMYLSISDGVRAFIENGRLQNYAFALYNEKALNSALAFLCLNDIQHSYSISELGSHFNVCGIKSVVSLSWTDEDSQFQNYTFWSTMEVDDDDL